jgi:hypothetical protein
MDLLKYIIVGIACIFVGIIIMFLAKSIFAGLGFIFLTFFAYLMWNYLKLFKDEPPPTPVA